jgi:ATP-binding cassette, subfamily B, bacterial PglK
LTPPIKECHKSLLIKKIILQLYSILDRKQRIHVCFLLLGMILAGLAELIGLALIPFLVMLLASPDLVATKIQQYGLQKILTYGDLQNHLPLYLVGIALFFLVKNLFSSLLTHLQARFQIHAQFSLSQRLLSSYLYAPYEAHLQFNSSHKVYLITNELPRIFQSVVSPLFVFLTESIIFLFLALALLATNPLPFLGTLTLVGGASATFYLLLRKRIFQLGKEQTFFGQKSTQATSQSLGGIKEIKVLGREDIFLADFSSSSLHFARAARLIAACKAYPKYFIEVIIISTLTLIIGIMLIYGKQQPAAILGSISFFAVTAIRLAPSLNRMVVSANDMMSSRAVLDKVCLDLDGDTPIKTPLKSPEIKFEETIYFDHVSYTYPGASAPSLSALSFSMKRGTTLALVGSSGSGKTTVANILLGLLSPSAGAVLVDGHSIHNNLRSWQSKIGYIPQSIYLADDSIRRNIAFGVPNDQIDETAIQDALQAAQLSSLVEELPLGLDQFVGEHGVRLSGGQIQRIGIARALYHRPEILLMDEATSALDNQTEQQITAILHRLHGQKTIFIIAHRLSTIQHADKIIFIEKNSQVTEGSYASLYQSCPAFSSMVDAGTNLITSETI